MKKVIHIIFIAGLLIGFAASCNSAEPSRSKYQVIFDKNNNWKRDTGETGLKNVKLTIINSLEKTVEQTVSDEQGYVIFKQNPEENIILFNLALPENQSLRCQPHSDHSACQILPIFEVSKTDDTMLFSNRIHDAKDDAEESNSAIKLYNK